MKKYLSLSAWVLAAAMICSPLRVYAHPSWGGWKAHAPSAPKRGFTQFLFRTYQKYWSADDGASCPFYPTCSAYAVESLQKHGFLYGTLLAVDRLLSEYPGMPKSGLYPLITKFGVHRPYDPVP